MASWPRGDWRRGVGVASEPTRLVHGAITSRSSRRWHRIVLAPGLVSLESGGGSHVPLASNQASTRGKVRGWSPRSVFKFMKTCGRIEWPGRPLIFVTLTYPGLFEADPTVWKEHLRRFAIAWSRQWGGIYGIWAMEFQARGAPHFHLALVLPQGLSIERITGGSGEAQRVAPKRLRTWVAETWYSIAGHGDIRHLRQHLKAEHCKPADRSGILGYLRRELGKGSQKTLPAWLAELGAGRWWGRWGLRDSSTSEPLTYIQYQRLHRIAARIGQERMKRELVEAAEGWSCDLSRRPVVRSDGTVAHLVSIRDRDGEIVHHRAAQRVGRLLERISNPRRPYAWLTLFEQSRGQWRLAEEFWYLLRRIRRSELDPLTLDVRARRIYRAALETGVIPRPPVRASFLDLERGIRDRAQLPLWVVAA